MEKPVELDKKIKYLVENESIYIPLGSKHRLSNPNNKNLTLIEVQRWYYVGEDDIVRFDDNMNQVNLFKNFTVISNI